MSRLGQWSAWVIPAAFFAGIVSRNMADLQRVRFFPLSGISPDRVRQGLSLTRFNIVNTEQNNES